MHVGITTGRARMPELQPPNKNIQRATLVNVPGFFFVTGSAHSLLTLTCTIWRSKIDTCYFPKDVHAPV